MFLTTGLIGSATGFWWDELARLVLEARKAAAFDVTVAGTRLHATWPRQDEPPPDLVGWRFTDETSDPRRLAYLGLWTTLQTLNAADRDAAMGKLRAYLGDKGVGSGADGPMSREEAAGLASGLVSVGAHGRTHVPLTTLSSGERDDELVRGRSEATTFNGGVPPHGFAYPHGSCDEATRRAVEQAGYRWAVGSRPAKIDCKAFDRYALPRIEAGASTGAQLVDRLRSIGF
jgi:peptidoglycan/xylan/chitin deacetylase (PgdA/CDA1 family)